MSDDIKEIARRPRAHLPEIKLPNDVAIPRKIFAAERIGTCEKTCARMNLPTIYFGGVAYTLENAAMKIIEATARRMNQAPRSPRATLRVGRRKKSRLAHRGGTSRWAIESAG